MDNPSQLKWTAEEAARLVRESYGVITPIARSSGRLARLSYQLETIQQSNKR